MSKEKKKQNHSCFLLSVCDLVFVFKENSFWILIWPLMVKPLPEKECLDQWDLLDLCHAVQFSGGMELRRRTVLAACFLVIIIMAMEFFCMFLQGYKIYSF